jgi:hypothetical protein
VTLRSARPTLVRVRFVGGRTSPGAAVRFFRSRRNEISFARTQEFATFPATCPPQTASVKDERPSLDLAEGEILEADLELTFARAS